MPIQTKPLIQPTESIIEQNELPESYFIGKGLAADGKKDIELQEHIWDFLQTIPQVDLSEVELDICKGVVTLMGTFSDPQIQGRVLHYLMHLDGVHEVQNQTRVLLKHPQMDSPNHA